MSEYENGLLLSERPEPGELTETGVVGVGVVVGVGRTGARRERRAGGSSGSGGGGGGGGEELLEEEEEEAALRALEEEEEEEGEATIEDPELEAIKARVREMEEEAEKLKELQNEAERRLIVSPKPGFVFSAPGVTYPLTVDEKIEADNRSVYVGNVDYGSTAEELESHFNGCGPVNRVTILCDKFTGHPKGYAYVEFAEKDSVKMAMALDETLYRGRLIKVLPKRTNLPGVSSTDRGGYRGRFRGRGGPSSGAGYYRRYATRSRGRTYRSGNSEFQSAEV
nr:PREDICTED: embryonic polyadenylate-binding protein 2 isoform X2 [Latimeria chalumnae]|eukprot:XP_014352615.1 PREDICTED: embryonic polyadenylate-binding protein 2 isoform X2 [Latimeria chalumnae]